MENKNLQDTYIDCLNEMLPSVDFLKLEQSCNSADDEYAKIILKQIHDISSKSMVQIPLRTVSMSLLRSRCYPRT